MATKRAAATLAQKMGFCDTDLSTPRHDEIMLWLDSHIESVVKTVVDDRPGKVKRRIWEYPILTGRNDFTVGFVDLMVWAEVETVSGKGELYDAEVVLAFEVKPKIPSLGELIRQIRHQETYLKDLHSSGYRSEFYMAVVSPDDRWATNLESQDIRFILAP